MASQRDEKGRFVEGNTAGEQFESGNAARLVHGGAGAVRRIQEGKAFVGLAAQEERQVVADLEDQGRAALVRENAIRLQVACRLYWGAVQTAADAGNLDKLDSYIARFGWLAGSALRAWAQVKSDGGDNAGVLDYEEILRHQREAERQAEQGSGEDE
jgi:hypothetical protein